ncbi:MAG: hypothetical protein RMI91_13095 [Gemmatales bacterium]|nr:hypothetical protein [Gemmatales bacterium]MDW7995580.1 hypothetical protein [Gemmatales bacterium]
MNKRGLWAWVFLVGCSAWYIVAACSMWAGVEPDTILYRSTVAGVTMAGLCWLAGHLISLN